ncbi:MAG: class I SAM-dependent methyltransferase [Thermoplasmata archaeon]
MENASASVPAVSRTDVLSPGGGAVPVAERLLRRPALVTPATRRALRHRMLLFRQAAMDRILDLTGGSEAELKTFRRELTESDLPDVLIARGAGIAFTRELPQGSLLYLLVRCLKPRRIVETGVRPGYSTAWFLAALDANHVGELVSLGPGPSVGRATGVHDVGVGQFVAPKLRSRWTLVLGNTPEHLAAILSESQGVDLFFYDNGPDAKRARFELHGAWNALSERGILLAHHVDLNPAFGEFSRAQGLTSQILDPGPPPMGAISMRSAGSRKRR